MTKQVETGEWEVDESGKRFRRIGNTLEYEMEVFVNGCYVPASQAESFRAEAESAEKLRKEALKKQLIAQSLRFVHSQTDLITTASEKSVVFLLMADVLLLSLQTQMGQSRLTTSQHKKLAHLAYMDDAGTAH